LTISSRKHDLIAISIEDPGEQNLPEIGIVHLKDPETGANYEIDFSDHQVRTEFRQLAEKERNEREAIFRRNQINSISLLTDQDYFPALRSFFSHRKHRFKHQ
jgi:uncharacterized protein (DUF58 family)